MSASNKSTKDRTLYVEALQGDFKITLTPKMTATFGPSVPQRREPQPKLNQYIQPSPANGYNQRRMSYALRVYQGKELVAVFTDVFGFWDESIPIARHFVEPAAGTTWVTQKEWLEAEGGGILVGSNQPQIGIMKV